MNALEQGERLQWAPMRRRGNRLQSANSGLPESGEIRATQRLKRPQHMDAMAQNGDARRDAGVFILHILLQRLEQQHPGLTQGMIDGILNDRAALPATSDSDSYPQRVSDEALRILRLATDQMMIAWEPLPKA
jgi:hypothetical protein